MGPKRSITCKGSPVRSTLKPAEGGLAAVCRGNVPLEADPQAKALFLTYARPLGLSTSLQDKAVRWAGAQPHLHRAHLPCRVLMPRLCDPKQFLNCSVSQSSL